MFIVLGLQSSTGGRCHVFDGHGDAVILRYSSRVPHQRPGTISIRCLSPESTLESVSGLQNYLATEHGETNCGSVDRRSLLGAYETGLFVGGGTIDNVKTSDAGTVGRRSSPCCTRSLANIP